MAVKLQEKYRPQAEDTSEAIDRLLVELWRAMPPSEKLWRVARDSRAVEQLALAGIRARSPEASEPEIRLHLATLRFGSRLARAALSSDAE